MIILVDNYDSFVHNLARYVREAGMPTEVHRNDRLTVDACLARKPSGLILSPGPGRPQSAGICCELIERAPDIPVLGVCLGHQCLAEVYGGRTIPSKEPMHGRASAIVHDGTGVLDDIPSPFQAGRYHSLSVDISDSPILVQQAHTEDQEIMAMRHRDYPHHGVQFHPESLLTTEGRKIISNFLKIVKQGGA